MALSCLSEYDLSGDGMSESRNCGGTVPSKEIAINLDVLGFDLDEDGTVASWSGKAWIAPTRPDPARGRSGRSENGRTRGTASE